MAGVVQKVVAYFTREGRLLVFSHVEIPEAGLQVPAGTLEEGEDAREAVLREAQEETGLTGLELVAYLETRDHVFRRPSGEQETARRHFFQLRCEGQAPECWQHVERYPSEGEEASILFELWWVPLGEAKALLDWGFGDLLHLVQE